MKKTLYITLSNSLAASIFGRKRKGEKQSPEIEWFRLDQSRLDSGSILK